MQHTSQTIPVVNIGDFDNPSKKQRFIDQVGRSLHEIGFFAMEGHGIDTDRMARVYKQIDAFFTLPAEQKKEYFLKDVQGQRGFTNFGTEQAKDAKVADLKEFWQIGPTLKGQPAKGRLENVWPTEIPGFEHELNALYQDLETCALKILKACGLYLGLNENRLHDIAINGESIMRAIHYPPLPEERDPMAIRAAAHEDINLITLLCESTSSGLELLKKDGSWMSIPSLKNQIIVDSGDMLQNITNGFYKSTTHRVVNPDNSKDRRYSLPFFVHPRPECDLSPLETCVTKTGGAINYQNITAGAYLQQRLVEIGLAK